MRVKTQPSRGAAAASGNASEGDCEDGAGGSAQRYPLEPQFYGRGLGYLVVERGSHLGRGGSEALLTKAFKVSNDPMFDEKVTEIVGLYLDPLDRAVVLCVEEKSQIQALDRTQLGLPLKKGRAAKMTHDYRRHGTTMLFAALDVKSGMVIGECLPRHRAKEFLKFLRRIDRAVPGKHSVHLVLDNYATRPR